MAASSWANDPSGGSSPARYAIANGVCIRSRGSDAFTPDSNARSRSRERALRPSESRTSASLAVARESRAGAARCRRGTEASRGHCALGLARRALLFSLRVFDAVGRLRYELEALVRNGRTADDASPVLAAVETSKGVVDKLDLPLEHGEPREVELARFGLARCVSGMLVGEGDVPAAVALRHGEALADPGDRPLQVGTLPQEPFAHRLRVHGRLHAPELKDASDRRQQAAFRAASAGRPRAR